MIILFSGYFLPDVESGPDLGYLTDKGVYIENITANDKRLVIAFE